MNRFRTLIATLAVLAGPCLAQSIDQHSVTGLVAAMTTPLSGQAIADAREFDDQLLSAGRAEDQRVYLVTDERSRRINHIAARLLTGMGERPSAWIVRVLDTTPPETNAFVVGGRYVYVFTGLLQKAESDDELAFVVGHELGHSVLKQQERRRSDTGTQLAQLIALVAAFSKGETATDLLQVSQAMHAQYSQQDEAEADAVGAAIAIRAGFDPLRGVDFFTRSVRAQDQATPGAAMTEAQIQILRTEAVQLQNACVKWRNAWNAGQMARVQANADQLNTICSNAEHKRLAFNQANAEYYSAQANKTRAALTSSHPDGQARVAALAATVDFLAGRRDAQSLAKYKNASLVMQALQAIDSPLLRSAVTTATAASSIPTGASSPHDSRP
jgi:predicted Zn-dependent protease